MPAERLCLSPQHCRSCLQTASAACFDASDFSSSPPPVHLTKPQARRPRSPKRMAIKIILITSSSLADRPGSSTPQCGHVSALVETSFPHSLHFVADTPGFLTSQCGHALALVKTFFPHSLHFVISHSLAGEL